jgi:hypothetical protein
VFPGNLGPSTGARARAMTQAPPFGWPRS